MQAMIRTPWARAIRAISNELAEAFGAVVDLRKQVTVQIDHASPTTLPGKWGFATGRCLSSRDVVSLIRLAGGTLVRGYEPLKLRRTGARLSGAS